MKNVELIRPIWYASLITYFYFLNNITYILMYFFTHTYFQKNRKLLFKHTYQTSVKLLRMKVWNQFADYKSATWF